MGRCKRMGPMLFLLNTTIVDVAVPEIHLSQRWRAIGCGEPSSLRAQDAISFVVNQMNIEREAGRQIDDVLAKDLAALIITKTGANSLIIKPVASGGVEPRLRNLPPLVLETYRRGADNDAPGRVRAGA